MKETNKPKVSVLLPNLNALPFLEERFNTIINQTFTDWELVVVDNYSDDGAWELIQEFAEKEPRMRISQAPREGIYANWNNCIRLARGEYIYIAGNDDTMVSNCLEKMVTAMDAHPECEICHTLLKVINEKGKEIKNWWDKMPPVRFYGELMDRPHIRMAPYDGILYCGIGTVYISFTQLLIRSSVFDKVGLFSTNWGSIGDFEWGMRAALVCNTLHIAENFATWRIHSQQATNLNSYTSSQHRVKLMDMIESALPTLKIHNPDFYYRLNVEKLLFIYRRQQLRLGLKEHNQGVKKLLFLLNFLFLSPKFLAEFLYRRTFFPRNQSDDYTYIRDELKRLGLEQCIRVIEQIP
ncbi:MAG: glycosyltransferase [Cyanobacteriota bacterium]|nr:glycosyltransferase [Cyanobacteriota bacterium]